jgi:hypothetical protein
MSTFRLDRPVIDIRMTSTNNENEYRIDLVEDGTKRDITTIVFKIDPANDIQIFSKKDEIPALQKPKAALKKEFKKVIRKKTEDTSVV